jgi:hypothetical protein
MSDQRMVTRVPAHLIPEVLELSGKLVELVQKYDPSTALYALQFAMPALWCSGMNVATVTEAVDLWRDYCAGCEEVLREAFGQLRYGEDEEPTTAAHDGG